MSNNSRANGKGKTSSAATEQKGVEYAARNKKGGEPKGPGAKGGGIPPQQQQQQQQAAAGGGGKPGGGGPKPAQVAAMSAKMTNEILSKYPRLYLDKENKQLTSLTALIDAAYVELENVRKRIDVLQEERKELSTKNREMLDTKHDTNAIKEKAKQDRDALRKELDKQQELHKRRVEALNKARNNLPYKVNVKGSKKLVEYNMANLEKEEKALEAKMKTVASTGQDRAHSKDLQAIAQKKRLVREWEKMAAEVEGPVAPAVYASLKESNDQIKKLIEEERETKKEVDRFKEVLNNKMEELKAAKDERKAISEKIEKIKKDRDAVYATIREKKKEHQEKVRQMQKEEREKKVQAEKEKRKKLKKEKLERQLRELSDAFKEELALCDRLTAFLSNRQAKQNKTNEKNEVSEEHPERKEQEPGEESNNDEGESREEEANETKEESQQHKGGAKEGEGSSAKKGLQLSSTIHTDFELLSVRPPTNVDEIPAAIESIARKKALYERLAGVKLQERKKVESQLKAVHADEPPAPKKQQQAKKQPMQNGTASSSKQQKNNKTPQHAKEDKAQASQPSEEAAPSTEANDE